MHTLKSKHARGFTLFELLIVMVIMAAMMTSIALMIQAGYARLKADQARRLTEYIHDALAVYRAVHGRLPCPAYPGGNGREDCDGISPPGIDGQAGTMYAPVLVGTDVESKVLLGVLPKEVLVNGQWVRLFDIIQVTDFLIHNFKDPWGNEIFYAVSRDLVDEIESEEMGVIPVHDGEGNNTGGVNNNAMYAFIMPGPNRGGDNDPKGMHDCIQNVTCLHGAINGITYGKNWTAVVMPGKKITGLATNKETADDVVSYMVRTDVNYWEKGTDEKSIKTNNLIGGNIGIQKSNPQEKLDVGGALYVEDHIRVSKICNKDGSGCYSLESFLYQNGQLPGDGPSITCTPPQYVKGIEIGPSGRLQAKCENLQFNFTGPTDPCASGKLKYIYTNGTIGCTD